MKVKKLNMVSVVKASTLLGLIFGVLSVSLMLVAAMTLPNFDSVILSLAIGYFFLHSFVLAFIGAVFGFFFTLIYNFIGYRIVPLEVE